MKPWPIVVLSVLLALSTFQPSAQSQAITQLFAFGCSHSGVCIDGNFPDGGLLQASDGNLYGTTVSGGNGGFNQVGGTIFKITPVGALTVLFTFQADQGGHFTNGNQARAGMVEGKDGFLYGTTLAGGASNQGVVFKISKTGTFQVLHSFCSLAGCADGSAPQAQLALGNDGNLYGTTLGGGSANAGTVFRFTPAGTLTTLHSLDGAGDGAEPFGGLIQASDGNFYGASEGGTEDLATSLFRITPSVQFTVLASLFTLGNIQGQWVQATNGMLYGAIQYDTVFDSTLAGNVQSLILLDVSKVGNGGLASGLIQASDGNLWGTGLGQSFGPDFGAVYSVSVGGSFVNSFMFNCQNGSLPVAAPIQGSDGRLFGTASGCGRDSQGHQAFGTVWVLDAGLKPPAAAISGFTPASGKVGSRVTIRGSSFIGTSAVAFNGVNASFRVLNTKFLTATVPAGATTGPISVTNAGGTATSKKQFTVN